MANEPENALYVLIDAQARHRRHPDTFEVPDTAALDSIARGDSVQICAEFDRDKIAPVSSAEARKSILRSETWRNIVGQRAEDNTNGERFWVTVHDVRGSYVAGVIDNDLVYGLHHGLKYGDFLRFEKRHVLNVMSRPH